MISDVSNPDTFLVSVEAAPTSTLYDVALLEDVTGLQVTNLVTPGSNQQLLVQPSSLEYRPGNFSSEILFL